MLQQRNQTMRCFPSSTMLTAFLVLLLSSLHCECVAGEGDNGKMVVNQSFQQSFVMSIHEQTAGDGDLKPDSMFFEVSEIEQIMTIFSTYTRFFATSAEIDKVSTKCTSSPSTQDAFNEPRGTDIVYYSTIEYTCTFTSAEIDVEPFPDLFMEYMNSHLSEVTQELQEGLGLQIKQADATLLKANSFEVDQDTSDIDSGSLSSTDPDAGPVAAEDGNESSNEFEEDPIVPEEGYDDEGEFDEEEPIPEEENADFEGGQLSDTDPDANQVTAEDGNDGEFYDEEPIPEEEDADFEDEFGRSASQMYRQMFRVTTTESDNPTNDVRTAQKAELWTQVELEKLMMFFSSLTEEFAPNEEVKTKCFYEAEQDQTHPEANTVTHEIVIDYVCTYESDTADMIDAFPQLFVEYVNIHLKDIAIQLREVLAVDVTTVLPVQMLVQQEDINQIIDGDIDPFAEQSFPKEFTEGSMSESDAITPYVDGTVIALSFVVAILSLFIIIMFAPCSPIREKFITRANSNEDNNESEDRGKNIKSPAIIEDHSSGSDINEEDIYEEVFVGNSKEKEIV